MVMLGIIVSNESLIREKKCSPLWLSAFAWNSASCVWALQIIATPAQYDAVLVTQNMHFFAQKIIIKTRFLKA